jgi:hypothetical protein
VLFGSTWYTRRDLPPWRAVWVQATGEFIVVRLDGAKELDYGPVRLLGTFPDLGPLEIELRAWPHVGWVGWVAAVAGAPRRRTGSASHQALTRVGSRGELGRRSMSFRRRACPLAYRYQPEALAGPAVLSAHTVYVVGGLYGITIGALRCDAIPVRFDSVWWQARFLAQWPPGSPGYQSYFQRISSGTSLRPEQAARGQVERRA